VKQTPRVGLIGCGAWGRNLMHNLLALGALRTVCDADPVALQAVPRGVATCADAEAVLADPQVDAVCIAAPAGQHAALCKAALRHGKDVFVEKPLCLQVEDAQMLAAQARRSGRLLMVGHLLCYHPAILQAQDLLRQGELGPLLQLRLQRLAFGKVRRDEDVLHSLAPHDVAVVLQCLQAAAGDTPLRSISVQAQGVQALGRPALDAASVWLRTADGPQAQLEVSWLSPNKTRTLQLLTATAWITFDDVAQSLTLQRYSVDRTQPTSAVLPHSWSPAQSLPFAATAPLRAELQVFLQALTTRQAPYTDAQHGVQVTQIIAAAHQSIKNNGQALVCPLSL
jgi:UDP-2-acetamido-3-amino-2,3-dideoxy-glucuronate N-acetyltransferase